MVIPEIYKGMESNQADPEEAQHCLADSRKGHQENQPKLQGQAES